MAVSRPERLWSAVAGRRPASALALTSIAAAFFAATVAAAPPIVGGPCKHAGQYAKTSKGSTVRCLLTGPGYTWVRATPPGKPKPPVQPPAVPDYAGTYGGRLSGTTPVPWSLGGFFAASDFEFVVYGTGRIDYQGNVIGTVNPSTRSATVKFATDPTIAFNVTSLPPGYVGSLYDCAGTFQFASSEFTGSLSCTILLRDTSTDKVAVSTTATTLEAKRIR